MARKTATFQRNINEMHVVQGELSRNRVFSQPGFEQHSEMHLNCIDVPFSGFHSKVGLELILLKPRCFVAPVN